MTRATIVLSLLALLGGLARADVVHLTTGRSVSGTIVREDEQQVVVRTPDGTMTFPRKLVASIDRQSRGETLLALARERARAGDNDGARRLLQEAAADKDPELAKRAKADLQALEAAEERARRLDPKPREPLPLPEGTQGAPLASTSLQGQLDRARRALEDKDHLLAVRLLQALVEGNPEDKTLRYLLGRGLELGGKKAEAQAEYLRVLGPGHEHTGRPVAHTGELARRQLAGEKLEAKTPGVSTRWTRVETSRYFAVYHPFPRVESWLVDEMEQALEEVTAKLEVPLHELRFTGRIQVFLFTDKGEYEETTGMKLAGGHALTKQAPDGALFTIAAFPTRAFYRTTLRHEVAHVIVAEVAPGLPRWADEGCATWCEPVETRGRMRQIADGRIKAGKQPPLLELLGDGVARGEEQEEVSAYYALANLAWDALVQRLESPRKAFKLCQRMRLEGVPAALKAARIAPADLEADMARLAAQSGSTD